MTDPLTEPHNSPLQATAKGTPRLSATTFGSFNGESQTVRLMQTTIHCTRAIRDLWPDPLARQWLQQYPDIFDMDDLRLARNQPRYHF